MSQQVEARIKPVQVVAVAQEVVLKDLAAEEAEGLNVVEVDSVVVVELQQLPETAPQRKHQPSRCLLPSLTPGIRPLLATQPATPGTNQQRLRLMKKVTVDGAA